MKRAHFDAHDRDADFDQKVQDFLLVTLQEERAVIERACEEALQGGKHGVLVVRAWGTVTAQVSPEVPFGHIYEHNGPL